MKQLHAFLATVITALYLSSAQADFETDIQHIDSACAQEAQTASCGNEHVGSGLIRCLRTYKKAHPEFKFSKDCKSALKTLRGDIKARRAANASGQAKSN